MERVRLAQFSDLHLGANLSGGKLALPSTKAATRRAEQRHSLQKFAGHVRETRPAAALIPGDLFDSGEPAIDDLNFAISTINSMAPVPVFIAPGNHDGYSPSSCYNAHSALYQSRGNGPKWGANVRIFTSERFETLPVPGHPALSITGVAYHRHMAGDASPLAEVPRAPQSGIRVLLFHGSLRKYALAGADREVLPFAAADLERASYTYAAIGHYHHGGAVLGSHGQVLGAYAGAPFAISLADEGVGSWLDIELAGPEPPLAGALHWRRCDERAIHRIEMDVTGLSDATALTARLDELLAARQAAPRDIVFLALRGRIARGVAFNPRQPIGDRFFHAVVDDSLVEPDYAVDLDAPSPEGEPNLAATSEELFVRHMRNLYLQAPSEEERARIKEALYYGLDALTRGEILLR